MIKRILHQNVNVTDMERSVKFYRDILGFKVGSHVKGVSSESGEALAFGQTVEAEFYFMTPPGEDDNATFIDLIEYHSPRPIGKPYEYLNNPGIARIAFLVDGIDKMYEYMKGKGMEFLSEPQTLDLRPDVPGLIRLVLFKDSDGTFLELFEYPYEEKSSKEGKPIIKRIDHIAVNVTDMERSVEFYRDILGFKVGLHKKGVSSESGEVLAFGQTVEAEFYFMTPPGGDDNATFIELVEYHSPSPIGKPYEHLNNLGIARIAFLVDGIDKMYEDMKGKGMKFLSEPQTLDLRPDVPGLIRLVLFKDPDGAFLELFEWLNEEKR